MRAVQLCIHRQGNDHLEVLLFRRVIIRTTLGSHDRIWKEMLGVIQAADIKTR